MGGAYIAVWVLFVVLLAAAAFMLFHPKDH
jgi:hypothetical protein